MKKNNNTAGFDHFVSKTLSKAIDSQFQPQDLSQRILHSIQNQESSHSYSIRFYGYTIASAFAMLLILGGFFYYFYTMPLPIELLHPSATIAINGKSYTAGSQFPSLTQGSSLESLTAQVRIALNKETHIVLDKETNIRYSNSRLLSIEKGQLYYRHEGHSQNNWKIQVKQLTLVPIGTEFDLSITADGLVCHVLEGIVKVERVGESPETVTAGNSITSQNKVLAIAPASEKISRWWPEPAVNWTTLIK